MDKNDLITYLGFVRQMEEDVYTLEQTKTQLTDKMDSLGLKRNYGNPPRDSSSGMVFLAAPIGAGIAGLIPALVIGYIGAVADNNFKQPFIWTLIVCVLIGVAFAIWDAVSSSKDYDRRLGDYKKLIADDTARVADEIEEKAFLEQERDKVDSMLDSLRRDLAEAYSYGIVYGTYQNFCAVSSFYEYISSGICEGLEGPDGAMRLYRNEAMQGRVVESLDKIIDSLDEIKANQVTLFDAIERGNNTSERLLESTVYLSQQNDQVIQNTAIDAHNSKIMKNDMNMLTWIAAGNSKW